MSKKMEETPSKGEKVEEKLIGMMSSISISSTTASPGIVQTKTSKFTVIDIAMSYNSVLSEADDKTETKEIVVEQVSLTEEQSKTTKRVETPKRSPSIVTAPVKSFAQRLKNAKNIIIMVGAGLSVAAGIPDFRTPGTGLYSQLEKYKLPRPEAVFEINFFKNNSEPFRQLAMELWPGRKYLPTIGHFFIKLMHDKGKLLRCYTQNIDSLEGMTGLDKEKIVAAHGNFDTASCVFTGKKITNMDDVRDAYVNNTLTELNKKYGTRLVKPDIVFFGESLPDRFHRLVPRDFQACDLLIVMGTSLQVHPFASLITMVPKGTPRMLINRERVGEYYPRGFQFSSNSSNTNDVFLEGDCDDGCIKLADAMGWGDELLDMAANPRL